MYNRLTSNLANPLSRKSELPEIIRYLSEALVWSEQNNNDFFQYFLLSHFMKLNIQGLFFEILCENECKDIRIQLIQSANILIHNLDKLENKRNF